MTSKELNLKLVTAIPQIRDVYCQETSWQDGDDTGSHIVYADVLVTFLKEQINTHNEQIIVKVFDYIENLLELDDEYANEVIAFSVLESLVFDDEVENVSFIKYSKTKTLMLIGEIVNSINM